MTLFRTTGFMPDSRISGETGSAFDVAALPPFLRTLLVTDGTVTKSLEAWFWEPVSVQLIDQRERYLESEIFGLDAAEGAHVLHRQVKLVGKNSGKLFAYASSWISFDELPPHLAEDLLKGLIGIGEILRERGVETYRDIVALDYLTSAQQSDELKSLTHSEVVSRSYRIRVNQRSAILVSEFFPLDVF